MINKYIRKIRVRKNVFKYLLVIKKSFSVLLLLNWITFQRSFSLGLQRGEEKHLITDLEHETCPVK